MEKERKETKMKKTKKLNLSRETLRDLRLDELEGAQGGSDTLFCSGTCAPHSNYCFSVWFCDTGRPIR